MNVRNHFLQYGEMYRVLRGGTEVGQVKATKNRKKAENRKYLMLALDADVKEGDLLVGTLSEQEFYIEEVEKSVFMGTLDGLDAFYTTKREHAEGQPTTGPSPLATLTANFDEAYDAIISHASDDKEAFVAALASRLKERGFNIWYDSDSLKWGDSTRGSIDLGIKKSKKAIVVLSESFFRKRWTNYELDGIVQRHVAEGGVILPIYHGVTNEYVRERAPSLADITAVSSDVGLDQIADGLAEALGKDVAELKPSVGVPTRASQCRKPRLVFEGTTAEARVYHVAPAYVARRDDDGGVRFYAPYPYRIAGVRDEVLTAAAAAREVLMLRGLPPSSIDRHCDLMTYQFMRCVPPDEEDEPCLG